jgi:hypothetical protein
MELTNIEAALLVLSLLLPGFLTVSLFRLIVPAKELSDQRGILSYLAFSTINYAFFGWLLWLAFEWDVLERNIFLAVLVWLLSFSLGRSRSAFCSGLFGSGTFIGAWPAQSGFAFRTPFPIHGTTCSIPWENPAGCSSP